MVGMEIIDGVVAFSVVVLIITLIFLFIAKRRMDKNEPVWGWKRKQFIEEKNSGTSSNVTGNNNAVSDVTTTENNKDYESILDLLELKNIERGVVERERNEYLLVLNADFVNFHLLQKQEQLSILEGYSQLYSVVNFPIHLLAQAVRQDFAKDRFRFEENLKKCNEHTNNYNQDVLNHIQAVTEKQFRITLRLFYIVKYVYEPSKLAKLTKEQREKNIIDNVAIRAEIVRRQLRRGKIDAEILDSVSAAEVLKRALNRDRMVLHPIDTVVEKEKLSPFVTMDFTSIPDLEKLVNNVEEALKIVGLEEESI
ncbi:TPA: hypothetical protein NJY08_005004 [Salmonella enterica subsp. enterica serovar Typhi str. AG3]|nr:hypothetical protein [Salmonella enterica subsp. enterica serovar Typhi str. AG3]